ncbi:MAG: GIY-YIG nuclease family protein [Bacteroidota bacterium]
METQCFVYILYSHSKDKFYVGYTCQLAERFVRHQSGYSKSTKSGRPWVIAYLERFANASSAYQRELQIKRKKSRRYLQELANSYHANPFPIPE